METRHWDESKGVTETLRVKESVTDYRYFPDPDLVEVVSPPEWVEEIRAELPELPAATRARLAEAGVPMAQAVTVVRVGARAVVRRAVAGERTLPRSPTGSPATSRASCPRRG
jgi:aspartyl-tRNA(Asn)/glutamyl-tRNA(Gln) amidotransferase subunit B